MKSFLPLGIVFFFSVFVIRGDNDVIAAQAVNVPQRYIVVLDEAIEETQVPQVAQDVAVAHGLAVEHIYTHALKGFSATIPPQRLNAVRSDPRVNSVVEDKPVQAFCHAQLPEPIPTGVNRVNADLSPTANINLSDDRVGATIAILDTGVYSKHYDLYVVGGVNCTKSGCPSVTPTDKNGHGTHVAGTAAAKDNNKGVVGVAPGARIRSVKVLGDNGMGWTSWVIAGINYVTANYQTIDVANMSLGGSGSDTGNCGVSNGTVVDPFHKAICNSVNRGVVYVVAAGNEGKDASTVTPAAYPEVITISAIADSDGAPGGNGAATAYGDDDSFASFSNFGAKVDIAAPGVSIYSTYPGDKQAPGGYCATMSGTSMATPHVSGAAALYVAANRGAKSYTSDWVKTVRSALLAVGTGQHSLDGFTADPDHTEHVNNPLDEPLLNVGTL
jgi:subtilisin family serine protease